MEPSPYISNSDNLPKAGLAMTVLDVDLDNVRTPEEGSESTQSAPVAAGQSETKQPEKTPVTA